MKRTRREMTSLTATAADQEAHAVKGLAQGQDPDEGQGQEGGLGHGVHGHVADPGHGLGGGHDQGLVGDQDLVEGQGH